VSILIEDRRSAVRAGLPQPATMVDMLRLRAEEHGSKPAFTYLANGEEERMTQTFAELDRQARSLAALIRSYSRPGDRALLLYPPSEIEFINAFVGCLYAGVIAVPVSPPHPARLQRSGPGSVSISSEARRVRVERGLSKVLSIVANARPTVVLTTERLRSAFDGVRDEFEPLRSMPWIATNDLGDELAQKWTPPAIDDSSLALLQYTSGSTSAPKGVMVTHRALVHHGRYAGEIHDGSDDVLVSWLPTFHDLGLIYGVLQPIHSGFRCYLMPPAAFIQRPLRWLRAMSRYGGTHSAAPNFAFDLCVRKTTAEERASLDLSRWRIAMNGAEPVRRSTLDRFSEAFAVSGFRRASLYPVYGLAEATLKVTVKRNPRQEYASFDLRASALEQHRVVLASEGDDARDVRFLVGCGSPALDTQVIIVNPETRVTCEADEVGEIWVSGPCVAEGYWKLPELSERTFRARLADGEPGSYLRTGDLGFFLGGQLVITGRLKDLIIVGGTNYYPQDLELTAELSHPDLLPGCSAAFSFDFEAEERVVLAVEVRRPRIRTNPADGVEQASTHEVAHSWEEELVAAVRRALAEEHQIQVHCVALIKPGSIPKTSSGKIQRQACRTLFLEGRLEDWDG
jgi:acyl-CoA synthetase (AMP-forming)/AMP-acid ligase II